MKENALPEDEYILSRIEKNARRMHSELGLDKMIALDARLIGLKAEMEFLEKHLPEGKILKDGNTP